MAGLTKEQRAEKARLLAEASKEETSDGLIAMEKNGETTFVHPTCVKAHQLVGWALVA